MPTPQELEPYLDFAERVAREAGEITLKYFRSGVAVDLKADDSPVTIADRETEQFIRRRILEQFPEHGILGEEFGEHNPGARWRWIIDPIDGTQAFITGVPLYCVLLALIDEDDSHLGVIHNPVLGETAAAARGLGCRYNGSPCRVSDRRDLAQARVHTTDYASLMQRRPEFCSALLKQTSFARTWADAHGYLLVATGRAEAMLDPIMNLWDAAALKPVIEEAGGKFTDLDGNQTVFNPSALATNGLVHEDLLRLVGG